jgi:hypothetical protein
MQNRRPEEIHAVAYKFVKSSVMLLLIINGIIHRKRNILLCEEEDLKTKNIRLGNLHQCSKCAVEM